MPSFTCRDLSSESAVMGDKPEAGGDLRYAPFDDKFSAATWRDQPLRNFLQER